MTVRAKGLPAGLALAALVALGLIISGGNPPNAGADKIPGCVEVKNLEAIVDDSGSMALNDPGNGRKQLVEIIADLNRTMTIGAVEFGTDANSLFLPVVASQGSRTPTIESGLTLINSDNEGTDYNDGFNLATAENPGADARLFLSDGEHNEGTYLNRHQAPPTRTYVVGFGTIDPTILNKIAADTGGTFRTIGGGTLSVLQEAMRAHAAFNCDEPPVERALQFNPNNQGAAASAKRRKPKRPSDPTRKVTFKADGKTAEVAVVHSTFGTKLKLTQFRQGKRSVKRTLGRGDNYVAARLRGLRKGKVTFKVVASEIVAPTSATAQMVP